jgi:hypothetical protein
VMLIADHINLTGATPLHPSGGNPFISMLDAYSPRLRQLARECRIETARRVREHDRLRAARDREPHEKHDIGCGIAFVEMRASGERGDAFARPRAGVGNARMTRDRGNRRVEFLVRHLDHPVDVSAHAFGEAAAEHDRRIERTTRVFL